MTSELVCIPVDTKQFSILSLFSLHECLVIAPFRIPNEEERAISAQDAGLSPLCYMTV